MFLFSFVGRALRRVVALLLLAVLRGRRVLIPLAGLLLVGLIALPRLAGPTASGPSGLADAPSAAGAVPATHADVGGASASSVDSYIKGLMQFDARLMWSSLSDEAVQSMQSRGGSVESLQKGLDDARQSGARYEDVTKVGEYPLDDGTKFFFYVMTRRGFAGPDQADQIYFVFTVDRNGKIASIA